jgi:hypothetical protein
MASFPEVFWLREPLEYHYSAGLSPARDAPSMHNKALLPCKSETRMQGSKDIHKRSNRWLLFWLAQLVQARLTADAATFRLTPAKSGFFPYRQRTFARNPQLVANHLEMRGSIGFRSPFEIFHRGFDTAGPMRHARGGETHLHAGQGSH